MIITDKKIDLSVETYLIEDLDKIIKTIKKFSEKHIITDNEKILSKKMKQMLLALKIMKKFY